jgi:hypothetical protein
MIGVNGLPWKIIAVGVRAACVLSNPTAGKTGPAAGVHRSVCPSPDLTVVPAENIFREAELNLTNVQLLLLKSNNDTLQS